MLTAVVVFVVFGVLVLVGLWAASTIVAQIKRNARQDLGVEQRSIRGQPVDGWGISVRVYSQHREVEVRRKPSAIGKAAATNDFRIVFQADLRSPLPAGLLVYEAGSRGAKVNQAVGREDQPIGHASFDRRFYVSSENPQVARAFLTEEGVAETLIHLSEICHCVELTPEMLVVEQLGSRDPEVEDQTLEALAPCVELLEQTAERFGQAAVGRLPGPKSQELSD